MQEKKRMTTRLKELFERPEIFVLAGGMNAMGARMAEVLGFDAFYMSGGNTSAQLMGWTEGGTSMRDMVDNARRIVNTVDIPVFCDMDTGYGDAITVYETVKEYIRAGIGGTHLEDQTYPPKTGPRRRCVSIEEMVGKLRAAMDAKMEFDPDFVIVARCDYGGVSGATFEDVMERCLAYKSQTNVDVVCPAVASWEENQEAIRRIPGAVLPLFTHGSQTHPTLDELQEAGAAAAWYPSLTTMAGLQASWDFLSTNSGSGAPAPSTSSWRERRKAGGARPATGASWGRIASGRWKTSTCPEAGQRQPADAAIGGPANRLSLA